MERRLIWERILIVVCAGVLLFFGVGLLTGPTESFSTVENRALRSLTDLSSVGLWEEEFLPFLSGVCADQFPLRGPLLSLRVRAARLLGVGEHRGILFGRDGYLIPKGEYGVDSPLGENVEAIRSLCQAKENVVLWLLPESRDVMSHCLPWGYPWGEQESRRVVEGLSDSFALAREALLRCALAGEQVFYRTDHHVTTRGAYECYRVLGHTLGWEPKGENYFERETVSEGFLGSSHSALGGSYPARCDTIEVYRYSGDGSFLVENGETKTVVKGFYDRSKLEGKDQYQIFMGGNRAVTRIRAAEGEGRPRYLLIKDSFANCLIPFLAIHADLDVVDPRYTDKPLSFYLEGDSYDNILLIAGIGTLATDASFVRVAW